VHSVDQRPNLRHLCEPLGGTEGLIETVGFKKTTEIRKICGEEQARMPEGSEFHTEGVTC